MFACAMTHERVRDQLNQGETSVGTHTNLCRGLEAATVAYAVDRHWRSCATRRCMDDCPAAQVLLVVQTEALTLWRKVVALASVPYAHAAVLARCVCVWLQLASRRRVCGEASMTHTLIRYMYEGIQSRFGI